MCGDRGMQQGRVRNLFDQPVQFGAQPVIPTPKQQVGWVTQVFCNGGLYIPRSCIAASYWIVLREEEEEK